MNFGHARIKADGMIYGFERVQSLTRAQEVVTEQNEFDREMGVDGDRWIVAEVREYGLDSRPKPE